jgi:lipoprotein-anchoring transpeptidase ErfK/SrfK
LFSLNTAYVFGDPNESNLTNDTDSTTEIVIQEDQPSPNSSPLQANLYEVKIMQINISSLNVRSGVGVNYSKLGSLKKGTKVEVVEQSNGWNKIKYSNGYGWCSGEYMTLANNSSYTQPPQNIPQVPPNLGEIKIMQVNVSSLNVRNGIGTKYSKLGSLKRTTKVEVVEQSNGWNRIKYKNGYGWCSGEHMILASNPSDEPPPQDIPQVPSNLSEIKIMQVNISSLNVRSGIGTKYSKLGSLKRTTKVEVVEQSNGWNRIKYKNGYGWCSGEHMVLASNPSDAQPPQNENNLSKGDYIMINSKINKMGYYKNGKLVKEFNVATGKSSSQTPRGKFKIVNKIVNRPYYTGKIPGGHPRNPLGNRWLGLLVNGNYGKLYGIHGTNNESSIGSSISGGCVRMHNKDIIWLYEQIATGTTVIISNSDITFKQMAYVYNINLA